MPQPSLPTQRLRTEHYLDLINHLMNKITDPSVLLLMERYKLQFEERLRAIELELIKKKEHRHAHREG